MAGLLEGTTGLLIDGRWEPGRTQFAVLDKYTQQPVAAVAQAGPAEVARAVTGALAAAQRPLPPARRQAILAEAARLLDARQDEIRALYVAETGFTPADAATELTRALATLRLSAAEAVRIAGQEIPVAATPGSEHRLAFTIRVPVGVVAAITPFNAPLNTTAHKVGPALAAGNAVVLKPAEQTPLCSAVLAQALLEAGLPPGFLQLVCGPGESTGAALVADRRVRFFTFTGSAAVGLAIKRNSGMAKTHLELGSNSASIVARDADLDLVADLVATAGYRKAGQVCTSVQRLLVHETVADELSARLAKRVAALKAGDPRDPAVQVGPLIAAAEAERAERWIRQAAGHGAAVLAGGTSSYHADAMPYGGVKNSGYGLEGPSYAVQDMTDPRIIVLNLRERP